jgi:hypothetical protein
MGLMYQSGPVIPDFFGKTDPGDLENPKRPSLLSLD